MGAAQLLSDPRRHLSGSVQLLSNAVRLSYDAVQQAAARKAAAKKAAEAKAAAKKAAPRQATARKVKEAAVKTR